MVFATFGCCHLCGTSGTPRKGAIRVSTPLYVIDIEIGYQFFYPMKGLKILQILKNQKYPPWTSVCLVPKPDLKCPYWCKKIENAVWPTLDFCKNQKFLIFHGKNQFLTKMASNFEVNGLYRSRNSDCTFSRYLNHTTPFFNIKTDTFPILINKLCASIRIAFRLGYSCYLFSYTFFYNLYL